jgi:hypothetical protein
MRGELRPDHLDALIEDTARAATSGLPSPRLRARVQAAIARAAGGRKRIWRPSPWQWSLAAAALVAALAAGWLRPAAETGAPQERARSPVEAARVRPLVPAPTAAAIVVAERAASDGRAFVTGAAAAMGSSTEGTGGTRVEPMEPTAVVHVELIPSESLAPPALIDVEAIEPPIPVRAEWIEIEPLLLE